MPEFLDFEGAVRDYGAVVGTLLLFIIVFAESGLLIGFFLPGDSLLFTAGFLSAQGLLPPLPVVAGGALVCAIAGDQVGYAFGRRVGPALFRRPDSRLFRQEYVERAQRYMDTHGPKTIVLARFIPIVRTFAPIVAGVGHMRYRTFMRWNIVGGVLWAIGVTTAGYALREVLGEEVDKYLLPIVAGVVLVSVLPAAREVWKHRRAAAEARDGRDPEAPPVRNP